ncbi:hypothetical protein SXCC_04770 [Gluconacetobacter sp. SXCC-1]|uniref:hypothetical protein n=2 Tax=Komagataeibacter rhaeticus TaxID=215221 RepID=UPI000207FA08|nr:hypothetical protein [Komagataeibacter rhaeticus]ATU72653.1 hypothetical protein CT154_07160 [Komagataeibacter xylinus]EGG74667.1 hypothetical protein SXCC_04770 [Gluconacetobacter sp. SXCC-1]
MEKARAQSTQKSRFMIAAAYRDTLCAVLQRKYGRVRHGAKTLAQSIEGSPRTVQKWIAGTSAPRGEELVKLMAECDELRDEIFRLVKEGKACPDE